MAKVNKSTDSSSLAEVVDRILDKGIVIDAWVKSVAGRHRAALGGSSRCNRFGRNLPEVCRSHRSDSQRSIAGVDLRPYGFHRRREAPFRGLSGDGIPRAINPEQERRNVDQ